MEAGCRSEQGLGIYYLIEGKGAIPYEGKA